MMERIKSSQQQLIISQFMCIIRKNSCTVKDEESQKYMTPCDRHLPLGGVSSEEGQHGLEIK